MQTATIPTPTSTVARAPILLYNDECGVCRHIARWVRYASAVPGAPSCIDVRPIGEDPQVLTALNPALNIWDAYDTIHLLLADGSMLLGGEAVAELLRRLPSTRWFAWCFGLSLLGWRPFQQLLNLGYAILSDVRPIFGCESCGTPRGWIKPFVWVSRKLRGLFTPAKAATGHSRPLTPR
jgi:predicted DCC family thiol-disulfide oxidoreductase YuxK